MFRFLSQRFFSSAYGNLKRVKPEYIDFETNFPKVKINKPVVSLPFTMEKNLKLLKSVETPQILSNCRVVEQLSIRRVKFSGRNNTGRITTRHRGGGHVQRIRLIDFKRQRKDIYSTVLRIEYDPTRSAHIALIQYDDGVLSYILCPAGVYPGTRLLSSSCAPLLPGNCLPLRQIPVNTIIHNVEIRPGAGGQVARSGGVFCTITEKDENFATLRLSSSEIRRFPLECWATVGQLSNIKHDERDLKKAGTRRYPKWKIVVFRNMGWRPTVRGIAMNPNKHPHGGGNKKGTKRPRCSIWGICKGMKTRTRKKPLGLIIKRKVCGRLMKKFGIAKRV
ncbi:50S ribosomal protein L2 [Theileria orientalis strain Shintoku]|uniref:50S ribosomal protein L2 n=1 Tax=Theileria orientalis strain Shintoku TaxID=869250 RepID=J4DPU5_THEOR|nr:50S ribosomal protein L2 [Theileria orientalis strain Shintoku]BAM41314.1 50S ribosomal protein L2 [Theileria orientalis strain Shintoku]|eukprot:XP_009691615.1 50S ribosomal protein L2 [Theileria orientalis strain Shintoku]